MGSGFKDFAVGEVLGSADVDNYLMKQTNMCFDSITARDAAITTPEEGMVAVIRDIDEVTIYTGSAWRMAARYGEWASYTPVWTADDGSTTLNNGTLEGRYLRQGSIVHFTIRFQWGTNTTQSVSSGNWLFSLPVDAYNGKSTTWQLVNAWMLDLSASTRYVAGAYVESSASPARVAAITPHGVTGNVDSTTPFTWANGDRLNITGFYEAA